MTERHARLLARFADQAASLAEDLCAAGLAAETLEEKQAATAAFHRAGRALRLAIALEAKLVRDQARAQDRAAQEAAVQAEAEARARTARRRIRVKAAVEGLIWSESDDEETDVHLKGELDERLDLEVIDEEAFLAEPFETQVARIAACIGLKAPFDPEAPPGATPAPSWMPAVPPAGAGGGAELGFDASG